MKTHLIVRFDAASGTYKVEVGGDRLLAEVDDVTDAMRVARGIAAWTHLPIREKA